VADAPDALRDARRGSTLLACCLVGKARTSEASYSISGSPEGPRSVDDRDAVKAAESAKALALPEEDGLPYANTRRVLIIAITVMRVAPMIVVVAVVAVTVIAAVVSIVVIAAVVTVIVMGSVVIISGAPIMSAVDASNAPRR
jgi:hypothetical protein